MAKTELKKMIDSITFSQSITKNRKNINLEVLVYLNDATKSC